MLMFSKDSNIFCQLESEALRYLGAPLIRRFSD